MSLFICVNYREFILLIKCLYDNLKIGKKMSNMNNGSPQGIGASVGNIDVLNATDIGVLRSKSNKDKSRYTRTTKPDGTVVEEIKMNQKNRSTGLVDLQTNGVNIGDKAVDVGVSEKSTEDAVGFVDSIWGTRQAAGKIQDKRMEEVKLEQFRAQRDIQLQQDANKRKLAANQLNGQDMQNSGRTLS